MGLAHSFRGSFHRGGTQAGTVQWTVVTESFTSWCRQQTDPDPGRGMGLLNLTFLLTYFLQQSPLLSFPNQSTWLFKADWLSIHIHEPVGAILIWTTTACNSSSCETEAGLSLQFLGWLGAHRKYKISQDYLLRPRHRKQKLPCHLQHYALFLSLYVCFCPHPIETQWTALRLPSSTELVGKIWLCSWACVWVTSVKFGRVLLVLFFTNFT